MLLLFSVAVPASVATLHAGTFTCQTDTTLATQSSNFTRFYHYRPGQKNRDLVYRDVEFMWDSLYVGGLTDSVAWTLSNLAHALVDSTGRNPFSVPVGDYNLVYDYFRRIGSNYTNNAADTTSVVLGYISNGYNPSDRSHADCYVVNNAAQGITLGGGTPSFYTSDDEDVTTGHAVGDVKHANSIQVGGPPASRTLDVSGAHWTAPDSIFITTFMHELQHGLPPGQASGFSTEMFSAIAEAVSGNSDSTSAGFDVPYTWSLLAEANASAVASPCAGGPSTTCVRAIGSNYQNRSLFGAYLAYNFRGVDSTASLSGITDDLGYRWVRSVGRQLNDLRDRLGGDSCGTCSTKTYFHPGGVSLDTPSRMALLHHNWRVANYVNNASIDEGQYGYPPQFHFAPARQVGAWRDIDGVSTDDIVAIPPEVTLGATYRTHSMALREERAFQNNTYPLVLQPYGAEYWIVKSDWTLWGTSQDLIVRITPEDVHKIIVHFGDVCSFPSDTLDARLVASVVAYAPPADSMATAKLWQHPEWAKLALPPKWVDVDSLAGPLDFTVSSFGDSVKAALVVLSLADGPRQRYGTSGLRRYTEALHYRLDLALRAGSYQASNPSASAANPSESESSPTWSPQGNEIAYQVDSSSVTLIRRKGINGESAKRIANGRAPDWSPRGNLLAFVRDSSGIGTDVWLYDTLSAQAQRLTFQHPGVETPAFSPNGQHVVYACAVDDSTAGGGALGILSEGAICVGCGWQIRAVDVSGANDTALTTMNGQDPIRSLRWSPDGQWLYFKKRNRSPSGLLGSDDLWVLPTTGGVPVRRNALAGDASAFDLHSGGGPLVLAQDGDIAPISWCFNGETGHVDTTTLASPFQRIATRDTIGGDTQSRFYVTGAAFADPRWAPDGTHIAYASNQSSGAGDHDVFVGQVSYNHAPQFPAGLLADCLGYPHRQFELLLSANDPDGETITFAAPSTFLPSGASFNSSAHWFAWPNPSPVCADKFIVFRALDGSGGVASGVLKITAVIDTVGDLNADVTGDTLVLLSWSAPGDSGTLGRGTEYDLRYAQCVPTEANWGSCSLVTGTGSPAVPGSSESKQVNGLTPATTYYFAIKTKDAKGHWSLRSNVAQVTTTSGGGGGTERAQQVASNVRDRRSAGSAAIVRGDLARDVVLVVEMGMVGNGRTWTVRELGTDETAALGPIDSVSVLLQSPSGDGWTTRTRVRREDAIWRYAVRGLKSPGRLVFIGPYSVRQVWSGIRIDGMPGAVGVSSAYSSRLGDFGDTFDSSGTCRVSMEADDTLHLGYQALADAPETTQDWFLLVGPPGSEVATPTFSKWAASEGVKLPTAFALRQNSPNPFFAVTTIRFDLPIATDVRLDIFDPLGRRIRTLVNGHYPAGFQSARWDHRTDGGYQVRAGVYLYRLLAGYFRDQKKMVLLGK